MHALRPGLRNGQQSLSKGSLWAVLLVTAALSACDDEFEAPSEVRGVRVLAVRADPASGQPGGTTHLTMLVADQRAGRKLEVAWLGGCHNPPTRQFYGCQSQLRAAAELLEKRVLLTPANRLPAGSFSATEVTPSGASAELAFEFELPADILSNAVRISTDAVHYGVSFVFFAVCAGELRPSLHAEAQVPFECHDAASGQELGYRDFVTGFATVYSFEGLRNSNPELSSVRFAGIDPDALAVRCANDADCSALIGENRPGVAARCAVGGYCVPRVEPCAGDECREFPVSVDSSPATAEPLPEGGSEMVWSNFYTNGGTFDVDTVLLSDRRAGWLEPQPAYYEPPRQPVGLVDLWVTINDHRGGAVWRSFQILVE